MRGSMLLRNVRPLAGAPTDILVEEGVIRRLEPGIQLDDPGLAVEDGQAAILVPGFVDAHTHLDKTFWGLPWRRHQAGPRLIDKIENERQLRREFKLSPEAQASNQIRQAVRMGTTHIRSHIDVDPEIGLRSIEGVLAAKETFKDQATIQLVAFPQSGLLIRSGTAELLDAAIAAGADIVGGLDPCSMDRDPAGHLNTIFAIADRHGVGVDIHLHEPGALGAFSIELIAERTRALAMSGKVTISHAFCLGMVNDSDLGNLVELILENRISIMTHAPGHSAFPPIRRLHDAGVLLCSGSDGIRDAWGPYGNADMLERAMLLGYRSNFRRDEDLELALEITTRGGAEVMDVSSYGLEPGCGADFVVLDGETLAEAIVSRRPRKIVVKGGQVVARGGEYLHSGD